MRKGRLKISGARDDGGRLRGQELTVSIIGKDTGEETPLSVSSLTLTAGGRKEYVEDMLQLPISELDIKDIGFYVSDE